MAIISSNIKLPTTGTKKTTTGGTTVKLPTTGGTYTSYLGTGGGTSTNPTTPIAVGQTTPLSSVGSSGASNGGTYTNYLSTVVTPPSGTVNGYTEVKPVNNTQFFDGGEVGTTDGGFSGGNNNGTTDEGVILAVKNADDATFDNNGFKGNGELFTNPSSGTDSEVIKTSASVGGNDKKEEKEAETGGGTGSTSETPMTYEEWVAEEKKRLEEEKIAAEKEAEIAKERAMANAQASYMQNMATYGANAEQLAQMGLTGGGYSDYLNAQAYAQKRGDAQIANAQEIASKKAAGATYNDGISALNKAQAENALYEERLAEERAYEEEQAQKAEDKAAADEVKSNYSGILIEVQNNPDSYTETGLRSWCASVGMDETQTQSVIDTWSEAQKTTGTGGVDLDGDGVQENVPNKVENDIDTAIKGGDIASLDLTISNADSYYEKGYITQEEYQEFYKKYSTYTTNTVVDLDYGSDYTAKLNAMIDQKGELTDQYNAGKITKETYDSLIGKINEQCSNNAKGGWSVQGLGSGRENDDIDITIGGTEYDLLCGSAINDSKAIEELNRIATGDKNKYPAAESGWTWLHGDDASSTNQAGKLIVAYGNMYIYTSKGWRVVKNDNNNYNLKNAIRAYLGG